MMYFISHFVIILATNISCQDKNITSTPTQKSNSDPNKKLLFYIQRSWLIMINNDDDDSSAHACSL